MATIKKGRCEKDDCHCNCTVKTKKKASSPNGVMQISADVISKQPALSPEGKTAGEGITLQTENILESQEQDVLQKGRKVLYLLGLDCAHCAQKIEAAVSHMDGVLSANVDFAAQKLTIDASNKDNLPVIIRGATQIIKEMEPDVRISYSGKAEKRSPSDIKKRQLRQASAVTGAALFLIGMIFQFSQPVKFSLFMASYLLVGGEVILRSIKNIGKGRIFDENFLMSVATVGAFIIGDFAEGAAVMLFYQVGEFFQNLAVNRSRKSISALMDIRPDYANLKIGEEVRKVSPEEVGIGELILIRPGEKVPLDGVVVEGKSTVDTAALTGESLPADVEPGSDILSGSVNQNGLLTVKATKTFEESAVAKILDLVQNASSRKAPTENFITKFAKYYTPAVVFTALALAVIPILFVPGVSPRDWINRALTFLVVSCPCAFVISIPLTFFGGIGGASKNGILIKGSNYLEALNNVDTVVFDKTGTLTKGNFKVSQIKTREEWTQEELLYYAAHAELYSNHPIAVSIREAYGREPDASLISNYEEVPGKGIRVNVKGKTVLAGNWKFMQEEKIKGQIPSEAGTVVFLAVDGTFSGAIIISDEMKPDSKRAIQNLKAAGVKKIVMLTGDNRKTAENVAKELGLDEVYAELLPQQKVEQMEILKNQAVKGRKLAFIGDGINDAPVLARADIGVAMGGAGTDAAIEAADVVLMTDEPLKLVTALQIAKKTRSIVWQNTIFALGVKILILIFAAFGVATMWEAVFGDVGVTIIAVLNAIRAGGSRQKQDR